MGQRIIFQSGCILERFRECTLHSTDVVLPPRCVEKRAATTIMASVATLSFFCGTSAAAVLKRVEEDLVVYTLSEGLSSDDAPQSTGPVPRGGLLTTNGRAPG